MSPELYIFGSAVRGEASADSDIDVLVIPAPGQTRDDFPPNWSVYRSETLKRYFAGGRLFAWHLYLEARNVYCATGTPLLQSLGPPMPYRTAREDIDQLEALLKDACRELARGSASLVYELGLAYTALRDIAMSASWGMLGRPCFSRRAPYLLSTACPLPEGVYKVMMSARHASTRGAPLPDTPESAVQALLEAPLEAWIHSLKASQGRVAPTSQSPKGEEPWRPGVSP
jgi:hypothetical protein